LRKGSFSFQVLLFDKLFDRPRQNILTFGDGDIFYKVNSEVAMSIVNPTLNRLSRVCGNNLDFGLLVEVVEK